MDVPYNKAPYIEFYYNHSLDPIYVPDYDATLMIMIPFVIHVCISLPALILMLYFFYTLRKHGGRILSFVLLLIINDVIELLLSAIFTSFVKDNLEKFRTITLKQIMEEKYMLLDLFQVRISHIIHLLITFRIGGIYLHQLVALQRTLSLRIQSCSVDVFSPLCATISCVILWMLIFLCHRFNNVLFMFVTFFPCCILVLACILTRKSSPSPDHNKPSSAVLVISTLTLISFCATAAPVFILILLSRENYRPEDEQLPAFLVSSRVISDPLLCVLVCNEQLKIHKQEMHRELSSDQTSV